MNKYPLIGVCICAVVLLVLGSLSNVVGIESAQSCGCDDPPCWPIISGYMGWNNWYVSPVTVAFNGSLHQIHYRINGNNWTIYTEPFKMKTQGIHLLEWTCDSNMSNISSLEIKIDFTEPILSNETVKRIGLIKWQLGINATDEVSGVNKVLCAWVPEYYDSEPPYQFTFIGFYRLSLLLNLIFPWTGCYWTFVAWDNAGNGGTIPSFN
jgi:hypothetical protein